MFCNFNHCKIFHANKLKVPLLEEQPKVRHYKLAKCKKFVRHVNPENIINVKIYNKKKLESSEKAAFIHLEYQKFDNCLFKPI